jgi:methylmalonyl-CoA mutase
MDNLFSEFKPVTADEWKAQVIKELKGEPFEDLTWKNENGIDIKPFYTSADLKHTYQPAFSHHDWEICAKADGNAKQVNTNLLKALNSGASAISVNLNDNDPAPLLAGIQLEHISSAFFLSATNQKTFSDYLAEKYSGAQLNITLFCDDLSTSHKLKEWMTFNSKNKNLRSCSFDALPYHNLGAFAAYEIAITLSGLAEYLEAGTSGNHSKAAFAVRTGVNADYFVQIAKLRALRRLWELLKKEYDVTNDIYVITETSLTNKSVSDAYNNLLRSTVEAMAAVAGGCNELVVNEYDKLFADPSPFSSRMALNQQLILKHESYMDKMADVACGSYYIESLTDLLAEKALKHFKEFEAQGGYFSCLEQNVFRSEISKQAQQTSEAISTGTRLAIGVNRFRNEKEKPMAGPEQLAKLLEKDLANPLLSYEREHLQRSV